MSEDKRTWLDLAPRWLAEIGVQSLLVLLVAGAVTLGLWLFGFTAGLTIPLMLAIVLGVIFEPLVDRLAKLKVPRSVGAFIVLVLVVAIVGGAIWITVTSIINQWPTILAQLQAGSEEIKTALDKLKIPRATLDNIETQIKAAIPGAASGISSQLASSLSSVFSFVLGAFLSFYMLFLVLSDYHGIVQWSGQHIGLPADLGAGVVSDLTASLRGYFVGSTIIAAVTTAIIAATLVILKVPLVIPIALVTFLLSYIPFFGAIVAGVFAVVIALGSGGLSTALIVLAVVLISQNVVQMPLQSWALGGALDLHPLVVLIATMLGGTFAGIVGATLGAPLTAMAVRAVTRVKAHKQAAVTGSAVVETATTG